VIVNPRYATQERQRAPETANAAFCDEVSGLRYYNPSTGRWLNRDPSEENGGPNLYAFTENDPVDSLDILGRETWHYTHSISDVPELTLGRKSDRETLGITVPTISNVCTDGYCNLVIDFDISAQYLNKAAAAQQYPMTDRNLDAVVDEARKSELQHTDDFELWKDAVASPLAALFEKLPCKCDPRAVQEFDVILHASLLDAGDESRRFWDGREPPSPFSSDLSKDLPKRHSIDQLGNHPGYSSRQLTKHKNQIRKIIDQYKGQVKCANLTK